MNIKLKEYMRSQSFRGILIGFIIAIIVLFIFQAGVAMGYRKATFKNHLGDNYYRAFGERPGKFSVFLRGDTISAHGAAGRVVSVSLPTFVVVGPDNVEKIVIIGDDTLIRRLNAEIPPEDIKIDDFTVVLGEPNESSQIEAKLIRVMPFPPESGMDASMRMKIRR